MIMKMEFESREDVIDYLCAISKLLLKAYESGQQNCKHKPADQKLQM